MEVSSLPRPSGGPVLRSRRLLARFGDDGLVDQFRRGNDAAFEVMFDRHSGPILSFCRHMLSSPEEAEDAVQHTFISAHGALRRGDQEINLKPWLYAIARNRCLSMLRARREHATEIEDVPVAGFTEQVQQRDELRQMLTDMHELPPDQRAALVLSELGDLSHAEIGDIVGCETLKVKSLVFQARSSLIESRTAREIPCEEIREQLATLSGGALRRGPLRRHVRTCEGCAEFRDEVKRQRRMVAALLPVVPTAGLKASVMSSVGIAPGLAGASAAAGGASVTALSAGGAGTVGAGGAAAGAGGLGAASAGGLGVASAGGFLASAGAAKLVVAAAVTVGAVGGGVAVERTVVADRDGGGRERAALAPPEPLPAGLGKGEGGAVGAAISDVAKEHGGRGGNVLAGDPTGPAARERGDHGKNGAAARDGAARDGETTTGATKDRKDKAKDKDGAASEPRSGGDANGHDTSRPPKGNDGKVKDPPRDGSSAPTTAPPPPPPTAEETTAEEPKPGTRNGHSEGKPGKRTGHGSSLPPLDPP